MQGWRRTREDSLRCEVQLPGGEAFFGIFDGHGGKEVAEFCAQEVVEVLVGLESYKSQEYEAALKECFIALDA